MTYKPTNILLTGCCGFIGSNLVNYLVTKYSNLNFYNIDRLDYCAREKNVIVSNKPNYKFIKGDISQSDLINFILNNYHIDTIIHLAAQSHVDNSFGNSIQFTKDNILATHILLECCRVYGKINRFIHVSTDEVYGEVGINDPDCDDSFLLNPTNPYAASKAGAEFLVKSYYKSFNLPIIITRGNNVYGPRQYPEKVIPKFIMQLAHNQKCTIQGDGSTRRNFIHVLDVCSAIDTILFKGEINQIYNIGTNNEYSVLQIAHKLIASLKNHDYQKWIEYVEDRNFNDKRYAVDSTKLKKLGWQEVFDFDNGLLNTIVWYVDNLHYWD